MNEFSSVIKGSASRSGRENGGRVVHLIEGAEPNGCWFGKALCGAAPGRRSYGWMLALNYREAGRPPYRQLEPTCAKCIARLSHD